ncbi:hypothetical protein STEG23_036509, partial [Scotinomys teguina]
MLPKSPRKQEYPQQTLLGPGITPFIFFSSALEALKFSPIANWSQLCRHLQHVLLPLKLWVYGSLQPNIYTFVLRMYKLALHYLRKPREK